MLTHTWTEASTERSLAQYEKMLEQERTHYEAIARAGGLTAGGERLHQDNLASWLTGWSSLQRTLFDLLHYGEGNCYCHNCRIQREAAGLYTGQELVELGQLIDGEVTLFAGAWVAGVLVPAARIASAEIWRPCELSAQDADLDDVVEVALCQAFEQLGMYTRGLPTEDAIA